MKKILLSLLVVAVLGAAFYAFNPASPVPATAPAKTASAPTTRATPPATTPAKTPSPATATSPAKKEAEIPDDFVKTVRITLSPQATFGEKEAAWEQLRNDGQLDQAIAALEKEAQANPGYPETFVALGRAYMYKSGTVSDISQVGALGMKIDQSFTSALKLDPTNWDAQYFRSVSFSFYPAFMNKGPDVVAGYQALIQQQESQAPQPQFANAYLNLGQQYQKQGDNDSAQKAWQRGAALFPDNQALQKKVSPPAAQQ